MRSTVDPLEPLPLEVVACNWYWTTAYLHLLYDERSRVEAPRMMRALQREVRLMCAAMGVELSAVPKPRHR